MHVVGLEFTFRKFIVHVLKNTYICNKKNFYLTWNHANKNIKKYMIIFQIAYHFTPKNEDDEWNVKCEESIQK